LSDIVFLTAESESLKIVGEIKNETCINSTFAFNISLYHDNDDPITRTITVPSCPEGIQARANALNSTIMAALGDEATVSIIKQVLLVGNATLVISFNPHWSKVKIAVSAAYPKNVYGLTNDTQKKFPFHFANGLTALEASLGISGSATVSATILDSVEVGATIDASVTGSLQFQSGTSGQLIPLDNWFSNLRSMTNPADPFHDPDFASAVVSVDGTFDAEVKLKQPFQLDVPASFEGYFSTPFELNLLDTSAIGTARPDVRFDINLPNIGDLGNLR
jgi:hypothetical protein